MKIYVVAHENIIIPKEYRKVEIEKEEVVHYIKKSVAYEDMLEKLNNIDSIGITDEEEYVAYLVNNWLTNQEEEFYKLGYYDIGDFDLIIEN
jgi:hypothetical protein